MSRTLYLSLDERKVIDCCHKHQVGVSVIERLPAGGVRLVCMSVDGAERMRAVLKKQLLAADGVSREPHRPNTPIW